MYKLSLKSSTSSPMLGIVRISNFSHSNRCIVISWCGFNLHFPNDLRCVYLFMCFRHLYTFFLMKYLIKSFAHLFKLDFLFIIKFWEFFIYFRDKSYIRYIICKHFLPVYGVSFLSLNSVFQREVFNFGLPFINLVFFKYLFIFIYFGCARS